MYEQGWTWSDKAACCIEQDRAEWAAVEQDFPDAQSAVGGQDTGTIFETGLEHLNSVAKLMGGTTNPSSASSSTRSSIDLGGDGKSNLRKWSTMENASFQVPCLWPTFPCF